MTAAGTPDPDTTEPGLTDPETTDPDERPLDEIEQLDEDELNRDPLEEGMDPPERWSAADRRPTPRELREGETLDERLAQEEPDAQG
ncbi:hypothetical protein [Saccharothrix australiensis]|uniref:DUF5709 domain-containing protein n=1 Tax=Saccharothrix australiensis TaxID=2072 RepID=A0A495W4F6_9PSEU|nr:hypothetical protein C8E97_5255 [Saccharothrix australiensis]